MIKFHTRYDTFFSCLLLFHHFRPPNQPFSRWPASLDDPGSRSSSCYTNSFRSISIDSIHFNKMSSAHEAAHRICGTNRFEIKSNTKVFNSRLDAKCQKICARMPYARSNEGLARMSRDFQMYIYSNVCHEANTLHNINYHYRFRRRHRNFRGIASN